MFKLLFDKRRKKSSVTALSPEYCSTNSNDREEDGFVLLGETAIERSTVLPDRSPVATEYLPSYNDCVLNSSISAWGQAMGQQPSNQKLVKQTGSLDSSVNNLSASFTSAHSGGSPRSITPSTPNRNTQFTEVTIQDRSGYVPHVNRKTSASWEGSQVTLSSHRSPVSDVPFKFNELVQLTQETRKSSSACVAQIPHVDVHSYRYDFELERSVMRDSTNSK